MARVAVVGGGAAGMGAAKVLVEAGIDTTLFDELPRLGGHCFAIQVPHGKTTVLVDAGVSDFNRATFHEVRALIAELGLTAHPVRQDATFARTDGRAVWSTKQERRVVAGAGIADVERFFAEIDRFQYTCVEVTAEARFSEWSARRYLDEHGYGDDFRRFFFNPKAGGSFPMPDRDPEEYFIRPLVAYWQIQGTVGAGPAERMVLDDGMHGWPAAFHIWFENHDGKLRLGSRVVGIARRPRGVRVRLETAEGAHESHWFDHVVLAASPHAIRSILEDPSADEGTVLGAFQWQRARVAIHFDASYVCADRDLIAAYNYVIGEGDVPETRPTITTYPKRLAGMPADFPDVFVTLNPHRPLKQVLANRFFIHPCLSRPHDLTTRRMLDLQGARNTWFAGAWLRTPHVHEQALVSGFDVGRAIVAGLRERAHGRRVPPSFEDSLRDSPIFAGLDGVLVDEVRVAATPFEARSGEILCREGQASAGMILITEGEVDGTRRGKPIATLGPGSLVGEISLLDGGSHPLTFVARTQIAGWLFDRAGIAQLQRDTSPAAFAMLDSIARTECGLIRKLLERRFGKVAPAEPPPWPDAKPVGPAATALGLPEAERLRSLLWSFPSGTLLMRAGEPGGRFAVVISGAVDVLAPDGTRLIAAGAGDQPGVLAVIDGGRQPFSFQASAPTLAAVIEGDVFREIRYGGSALAAALMPRVHGYLVANYRTILSAALDV